MEMLNEFFDSVLFEVNYKLAQQKHPMNYKYNFSLFNFTEQLYIYAKRDFYVLSKLQKDTGLSERTFLRL